MRATVMAVAVFCAGGAMAQAPAEDPVHDELRALQKNALEAISEGDSAKLLTYLHPEIVFTTTNGEAAVGHDGVKKYFDRMLVGPEKIVDKVDLGLEADELSVLHGDDAAVAYGKSTDTYLLTDGDEFVLKTRWSATLVKQGDKWLLGSFHSSVNVFDNAMLTRAQSLLWYVGGGVLILGLIGGFFVGRRRAA